ncbi:MAG: hypothetical protein ABH842_00815 [Candidatus Micrarchaeota archaeon]
MALEFITDSLGKTIELLKKDFFSIFKGIFLIQFLATIVVLIGIGIAIAPYLLLGISAFGLAGPSLVGSALIITIFAVIILFVALFFSGVVNSVSYNFIDKKCKNEELDIIAQIRVNIVPFFLYVIANILITLVILGPFYVIYLIISLGTNFSGSPMLILAGSLIELVLRVIISIVAAILHLFIQFAIFEVIIARKGIVESFKRSIDIVKNNLLETFLFSLLLWAIISAVMMILLLVLVGIGIVIGLVLFGLGMIGASALSGVMYLIIPVGLVILAIVFLVLIIAIATLQNLIEITAQYNYWKLISKG